jgi:hypothetical protein
MSLNLFRDPDCEELSEAENFRLLRAAATLKRDGMTARFNSEKGHFYLRRGDHGVLRLSRTLEAVQAPIVRYRTDLATVGPLLWGMLEQGAETPEKRLRLAESMTALLPCGDCKTHWSAVVQGLTAASPEVKTNAAFGKFIWREHNKVNKRLGKREFPWKEVADKYTT